MCKGENCGGEFRTWPNGRISGVVAEFVDGTETVVVWIRGCTVPCHIKPTEKVAIGDTLELEAQVVGGGKKALALDCQGQTLTLDPKYAAWRADLAATQPRIP